ncbi:MAG: glycogen synthase GlgA [Pseudomonadota bacterium]
MTEQAPQILFVVSECAPLVKTGGLADVAGALPTALEEHGVRTRVLLPGYRDVMRQVGKGATAKEFGDLFGAPAKLLACTIAGLDLLVLDAPHLYDRDGGLYVDAKGKDWADNPERFAALCQAAAAIGSEGASGWFPDLVHGHDWQAGLTPEYLAAAKCDVPFVFTIHNIAFHGNVEASKLDVLGLDPSRFHAEGFEFWGQISALKAGLMGAAKLNTVSQTYAQELLTPEFGIGMDGVLRRRQADFIGIVNGIDESVWSPATDPNISNYFTATGKAANKKSLQNEFGLPKASGPLCVMVSRLTEQKGIDLLLEALPELMSQNGQLVVLGSGDTMLETRLLEAAANHENVAVKIGYDEALSHRMIAGGDVILVPSRFEPCGLTQLYGLRYGTVPLVSMTGGLADTVINASPAALASGVATGIQFFPIHGSAMTHAVRRLGELYAQTAVWRKMQRNAMKQSVGWDHSAADYLAMYAPLVSSTR